MIQAAILILSAAAMWLVSGRSLTPKQEEILQGIEKKVFGGCDDE